MPATIRPLNDRIVCRRVEAPERIGSIIVPDTAKEKATEAIVVAIGPGAWPFNKGERKTPDVRVGDRVLFKRFTGVDVTTSSEEVFFLREDEVLAVVEP